MIYFFLFKGEKPYECAFCSVAFNQSNLLKVHIKKHHPNEKIHLKKNTESENETNKEKPDESIWYPCSECSMKFSSNELLLEHMGKHAGNRPFACELCGMTFPLKFALQSHILSHEAERIGQKLRDVNETCKKGQKRRLEDNVEIKTDNDEEEHKNKKLRISKDSENATKIRCNFCPRYFVNDSN